MHHYLRLSFRLLDGTFHGRRDRGQPEWPPSPLRAFQSLVAAAGQRCRTEQTFDTYARPSLLWLEGLGWPVIVAPRAESTSATYRLFVPNNHADVVAVGWRGGDHQASIAEHRVQKSVRPTRLMGGHTVHYLWAVPDEADERASQLDLLARETTHLGWGTDMVAAAAGLLTAADVEKLDGDRWYAAGGEFGMPLRVPKPGSLDALVRRHAQFRDRIGYEGIKPPIPLSCFAVVGYQSPTVPTAPPADPRPVAAFEIHRTIEDQEQNPGKSKYRPFHHVRQVAAVAGMVRHAAAAVARAMGETDERVNAFVLGHGDDKDGQATSDDRLQFLPLPSLTPVGVGGIRRVLVAGPPGCDLAALGRRLNGADLIDEATRRPVAMLSQIATTDKEVRKYAAPSTAWATVTPVVLPGHEDPGGLRRKYQERVAAGGASADEHKHLLDRLGSRVLALLWKAFRQAGWAPDALAGAELEYRTVGWFRGLDLAANYRLPKVDYPRYHVRVRFPRPVPGPLAVGAGRYRGLGVFAAE